MDKTQNRIFTRLRKAFFELNRQSDIGKISVRTLTDTAGISRSLFYVYYSDIYALRAEIEDTVLREMCRDLDNIPLSNAFRAEMPKYNMEWISRLQMHRDELRILCGHHGDGTFRARIVQRRTEIVENWMLRDEQRLLSAERQRILNLIALFAAESEISWVINFKEERSNDEESFKEFYQMEMFLRENVLEGLERYPFKKDVQTEHIRIESCLLTTDEWVTLSSNSADGIEPPNAHPFGLNSVADMQIYTAKKAVQQFLDAQCSLDEITIIPINMKVSNVLLRDFAAQCAKKRGISVIEVTTTVESDYVLSVAKAHIIKD